MSGATYSLPNTLSNGNTADADEVQGNFTTIINNHTPTGMDDHSATDGQARTQSDPFPASTLSKATSLSEEIEQLRYQLDLIIGETYWYEDPNTDLASANTHYTTASAIHGVTGSVVGTTDTQTLSAKTLTTPTIGSMVNATHDHADAAGGGALTVGVMPAGSVVQMVSVADSAVNTGTTAMVMDDTIPQNTEGDEYMTLAITPTSATNKLIIEVQAMIASTTGTQTMLMGLFQDSTANALAVTGIHNGAANYVNDMTLKYVMVSGTASETTFKVRVGHQSSGTTTFNGVSGGRMFGGVAGSSIIITEVAV